MCVSYTPLYIQLNTQWRLSTEPQNSLSVQHPPILWPVHSSCLDFPRLPAPYSQFGDTVGLTLDSPSLCCTPETFFTEWSVDNDRAHLISFPPLRGHCLLFSYVLCLVNLCFIYIFCCFSCSGHEDKSRPCYSISANSRSACPLSKSRSPHNSINFLLVKTSHMTPLGYNRGGDI